MGVFIPEKEVNASNQGFVPCLQTTLATMCLVVDHLQGEGITFQKQLLSVEVKPLKKGAVVRN